MFSPFPLAHCRESEPELHEQHWFWIGLNRRDPAGDRSWRWSDGLGVSPGGIRQDDPGWHLGCRGDKFGAGGNAQHRPSLSTPSFSTTTLTTVTTMTMTSGPARCWTWPPCSGCRCSAKPSWTGSANCPKVPGEEAPKPFSFE